MKKIFLLAAAVLVSVQLCAKAPGGWENKIDKAKIKAQSAGKPIFIVISGAEWDKRSQAFEKQLFENKNFLKLAGKYAVCVYIEHPETPGGKEKAEIDKCSELFGEKLTLPACAVTNAELTAVGPGSKIKTGVLEILGAISTASVEIGGAEMKELPKLKAQFEKEAQKKEKEKEKKEKKKKKRKKEQED